MPIKNVFAWFLFIIVVQRLPAQVSVNGVVYVNTYKMLAIAEEQRSGIPASIILAQGLHETEAGTSELVKQSNNHFGIKCKDDWKGQVVYHDDDARQECFRSYATAADSYRDHSDFLKRSQRYAFLFQLDPADYEGWAYGLKKAGYATNIKYSQILIKLVRDYNLQQYTLIAIGKIKPSEEVVLTAPGAPTVSPVSPAEATVAGGQALPDKHEPVAGTSAVNAVPDVAYPEGEFSINKTKVVYAVAGTSLLAIANQYELSLPRLMEFNDLKEQDVLVRGQLIFLQRKRRVGSIEFHLVREGEDLYTISQAEGIRLQDLLELNQLNLDARPAAGEKLYLQKSAPSRPRLVSGDNK